MGRKAGISDAKLLAVTGNDNDLSVLNDVERLVIELADTMAGAPVNVSDDLYARLRQHFSEEQLMELGAHVAFENYRARWNPVPSHAKAARDGSPKNRIFDVGSDELYRPQEEGKGKAAHFLITGSDQGLFVSAPVRAMKAKNARVTR